jgi:hypothetical protein
MILPNVERAIVPQSRIAAYLLDETHREGGGKALFFYPFRIFCGKMGSVGKRAAPLCPPA